MKRCIYLLFFLFAVLSCGEVEPAESPVSDELSLTLPSVAKMLSSLPITKSQMDEVHDAVNSSSDNGYDEEYLMSDLLSSPGKGVRSEVTRSSVYETPMRSLIEDYLRTNEDTRAWANGMSADDYLSLLESSDIQIYWPYSENWDGEQLPIITFDPNSASSINDGYQLVVSPDGSRTVEKVTVSEAMAMRQPVWVVNRNDDSGYSSIEMRRREDPSWGEGGEVLVRSGASVIEDTGEDGTSGRALSARSAESVESAEEPLKTLVLKSFKANRNYDSWFGGASEFFVKCGSISNFNATSELDLRQYAPTVTDFMIVVKRSQKGQALPFNAVLISEWTDQLDTFAFMIVEDDGGTSTSWDFEATVKVQSKSYGVTLSIPYKDRDDIVWRGGLSSRYFKTYAGKEEHFGDADLVFDILEE